MRRKDLDYKKVPQNLPIEIIGLIMDYYRPCPPDKILNLNTRRCVKRNSPQGRRLQIEQDGCPPGKMINPHTRRCISVNGSVAKKLLATNNCPEGKMINPETKRCVSIDGPIGRRIRGIQLEKPPCPEGKVRSQYTGRCVNINSVTLKQLNKVVSNYNFRSRRKMI